MISYILLEHASLEGVMARNDVFGAGQADRIHVTNAEIEETKELVGEAKAREQKAQADHARLNAAHERQRLEAELATQARQIAQLRQVHSGQISFQYYKVHLIGIDAFILSFHLRFQLQKIHS